MSDLRELIDARRQAQSGEGRRLREAAQLSLRELASQIGVDAATLDRWERGQTRPRHAAALKYQAALTLLADALQEDATPTSPEPTGEAQP